MDLDGHGPLERSARARSQRGHANSPRDRSHRRDSSSGRLPYIFAVVIAHGLLRYLFINGGWGGIEIGLSGAVADVVAVAA